MDDQKIKWRWQVGSYHSHAFKGSDIKDGSLCGKYNRSSGPWVMAVVKTRRCYACLLAAEALEDSE